MDEEKNGNENVLTEVASTNSNVVSDNNDQVDEKVVVEAVDDAASETAFTFDKDGGATFDHLDSDGQSSAITVANTDEYIEVLRDRISGLGGVKKTRLDEIENKGRENNLSRKEVKALKKEFKTSHKQEKKRLKDIKDNMNTSNQKFAGFHQLLKSQVANHNINYEASAVYGANKLGFCQALLNQGKPLSNGSKSIQGYDDDGNMVFIYVDENNKPIKSGGENLTLAAGGVDALLVQKSPKREFVNGLFDRDSVKRMRGSTKYGFEQHEDDINGVVEEHVTDKNTFLDFAFHKISSNGKESSLADAIHNVEYTDGVLNVDPENPTTLAGEFITVLSNMGNPGDYSKENPHPYDMDGDGDFDEKDYMTEENYMKLAKQALSGKDLQLSKLLLKTHYKIKSKEVFDAAKAVNNPVVVEGDDKKSILAQDLIAKYNKD